MQQQQQQMQQRVARLEQQFQMQRKEIQHLREALESRSGPRVPIKPMDGAMGERERTPRGRGMKPRLPVPAVYQSLDKFAAVNKLDAKCIAMLKAQPTEVQQHIISRGDAPGSNASAMVSSRLFKVFSEYSLGDDSVDLASRVEDFIGFYGLDDQIAETLRSKDASCQAAVLARGPCDGTNASAMVMGRIIKFTKGQY